LLLTHTQSSIAAHTAFVNPMYDARPLFIRGLDGPSGIINPLFLDSESPSSHEESYSEVLPSPCGDVDTYNPYDAQATSTFSNPMYSRGSFVVPAGPFYRSSTDYMYDGANESHYDVMRFTVPTDSGDFLDSDSGDYLDFAPADFAPAAASDDTHASSTTDVAAFSPNADYVYEVRPKQGTDHMYDVANESHYDVMRFTVPTDSGDFLDSDSGDYLDFAPADFAPAAASDDTHASSTTDAAAFSPNADYVYEVQPKQGATEAVYAQVSQGDVVHGGMHRDEAGYLVVDPSIVVDPTGNPHDSATYAVPTEVTVVARKLGYDRAYVAQPVKSGYDVLHTALPDDELLPPE
jgi:hypothetical protein